MKCGFLQEETFCREHVATGEENVYQQRDCIRRLRYSGSASPRGVKCPLRFMIVSILCKIPTWASDRHDFAYASRDHRKRPQ